MKAWVRSVCGMYGLATAGLFVALTVAVSPGQDVQPGAPDGGEPPMVDAPPSGPSSAPPGPPFTPPPPTPLPPEQAAPFVPAMPSPFADPLEPPAPIVRLRVRAPARVEPDKEIEYRLIVQNVSSAAAHHVLVRDRLPHGVDKHLRAKPEPTRQTKVQDKEATDLLWELGTLKAGDQKEIVLTIKPQGNKDIENRAYVQFEHGQKVTTRIARPKVSLKVTLPPQAVLIESIPLRIEVANTGSIPLRNVIVTDELPPGLVLAEGKPEPDSEKPLTWKLGDLPPRHTRQLVCQVISQQAGPFRTQVNVKADGDASATGSASVMVGERKLKISIRGPQRRMANRPIPYHITVRNLGTMPVTNVGVSGELPKDIQFVSANEGGRKEGGFVRWSLGTLRPDEQRSLLLVIRAPQPGTCRIQATVRADNNLSDQATSEDTRLNRASAPVIEIDKNKESLDVGQKESYTIRLFNPGKQAILNPGVCIRVGDELSITGERGETTGQREGQLIRFAPLRVLDGGREALFVIDVEAKKPGEAKLQAWWTDGRAQAGPQESWDDKTIILDSARPASGVASVPQAKNSKR